MVQRLFGSGLAVSLFISAAVSLPLLAQDEVGALYGTVTDSEGVALPGVSLSLTGMGATKHQYSDRLGKFWFLGLDPGLWSLEAGLDGFAKLSYPNIEIRAARNTSIEISLSAAIHEVISVTAESPLLDERKLDAGTRISQVELEKIPTGRDPWVVLSQAPGVFVDRVDVGGSESDTQALFRTPSASLGENDYIFDGVQISIGGGSATYYDFDQFQEIQIATGGNDVAKNTMGVSINLVTKRGSNEMRGSARFLLTDGDGYFGALGQADPGWSEEDLGPGQSEFIGDSIDRIEDYGFQAGGPAWPNRVWLWGSWAQKEINKFTGGGDRERFVLENTAIKLNAQLSAGNSFVGSWNHGDKRARGRNSGPNIDPSATFDQRGPTGITKLEDSHIFGSSFFLSGQYSYVDAGLRLEAQGGSGPDQPATPLPGGETNIDANGYWTNNYSGGSSEPIEEWKLDGSYFFITGTTSHELKFGGRLRGDNHSDFWSYPGRNLLHIDGRLVGVQNPGLLAIFGLPPDRYEEAHFLYAYRGGRVKTNFNQDSAWIQDTLTRGPWTINVGFRYDLQDGWNDPGTMEANPAFPEEMPAVEFAGNDGGGLRWESLSPRFGLTYALGEQRETLLRGSLSQFPAAIHGGHIRRVNPIGGQIAHILFLDDPGGFPSFYDDGEPSVVIGGVYGYNPADPYALTDSNRNDPDMDVPTNTELILGAERSFLPELVTGLSATWRKTNDWEDNQRLFTDTTTGEVRTASAAEYLPDQLLSGELPDGSPYEVPTYAANPTLEATGGELFTSGDRSIEAFYTTLTFTKRLSNRWMARGHLTYNFREQWNVPASYFDHNDPNRVLPGDTIDGGTAVLSWSFLDIGLQADWLWNLNGMYQVAPDRTWGFNIATNLTGRQGYTVPYRRTELGADDILRRLLATDRVESYRYGDIFIADFRLEKEFAATGNTSLTFSIDGFNIFNDGTVLGRQTNLNVTTTDWVLRTVSPRVWRLGVRLNWR